MRQPWLKRRVATTTTAKRSGQDKQQSATVGVWSAAWSGAGCLTQSEAAPRLAQRATTYQHKITRYRPPKAVPSRPWLPQSGLPCRRPVHPHPRPRFTQPVGDPRDARGLYAAMRRFLEHRGITGSTESSLYNLNAISATSSPGPMQEASPTPNTSARLCWNATSVTSTTTAKDGAALSIASRRAKIVPLRSF